MKKEIDVTDETRGWIGLRIEQVRCEAAEYQHRIGRKATVTDAFIDEKGQTHVQTDDGVWCPTRLVAGIGGGT